MRPTDIPQIGRYDWVNHQRKGERRLLQGAIQVGAPLEKLIGLRPQSIPLEAAAPG